MPENGIELTPGAELLTRGEYHRLVSLFAKLGVSKVRLTGGEPLVHPDVVGICSDMSSIPGIKHIAMTTNGILIPRKLNDLIAAGVTGLNISLDTLDEHRFQVVTRRNGLSKVLKAISLAEAAGFDPVKINCVVMRGVNEDEIGAFVELTRDRPIEVRFIEYMPFDQNQWERRKMVSFMETMDAVESYLAGGVGVVAVPPPRRQLSRPDRGASPTVPPIPLQAVEGTSPPRVVSKRLLVPAGVREETAKLFKAPGYRGTLGFITSMTTHFCAACNRLRLTADGNLKVCLFGNDEVSLRDPLRAGATDEELEVIIRAALQQKHKEHGGMGSPEEIAAGTNRSMIRIGG